MKMIQFIYTKLTISFRYLAIIALFSLHQGCEDTNLLLLTDAGIDAVNAITLSDEDVINIAAQAAVAADSRYRLAPADSIYSRRLQNLVAQNLEHESLQFDFKVYLTEEVNAFAMANGTVRIYSGLMDLMDDGELLFVIGHEMGHVVKKHSRKKVVLAYASSALRKGLASQQNNIGEIASSAIGALAQQLTHAQFSQHEEKQADDYGVVFLQNQGYGIDPGVSALNKLEELAGQHTFLSSHPQPRKRAERLESGAHLNDEQTFINKVFVTLKKWCMKLISFVLSFF